MISLILETLYQGIIIGSILNSMTMNSLLSQNQSEIAEGSASGVSPSITINSLNFLTPSINSVSQSLILMGIELLRSFQRH